jgi:hypothetical protein
LRTKREYEEAIANTYFCDGDKEVGWGGLLGRFKGKGRFKVLVVFVDSPFRWWGEWHEYTFQFDTAH